MHRRAAVLGLLVLSAAFLFHVRHLAVVAEDAYVSFRFAQNWASGAGLTWNPGEPPVEGYTNFLWVALMAGAIRCGVEVALFSQLLGIAAALVTLAYTYRFCRGPLEMGWMPSLVPCAFLVASGPFATWAASGMETSLFALLVTAATYHMVAYWRRERRWHLNTACVLSLLATLTRPEGLGVFLVLALLHGIRSATRGRWRDARRFSLVALAFYFLPFALFLSWRLLYYGYLLPNTFYAKTGGSVHQWQRGAVYAGYFVLHFVFPVLPMLAAGLWESTRLRLEPGTMAVGLASLRQRVHYGSLGIAAVFLAYSAYIVYIGGDYMAMYRFFVPIIPLGYILLAHMVRSLIRFESHSFRLNIVAGALVVFGLFMTVAQSTPLEWRLFAKPASTHGQYGGVLTERWHVNRLTAIGHFFRRYAEGEGATLALAPIGVVPYLSGLTVYGVHGLVDPHIAHQSHPGLGRGFPGHEKTDYEYVLERKKPTYFMFTRRFQSGPCDYPVTFDPEVTAIMERDYDVASVWLRDEANGEAGYFCFLQRKTGD